MSKFDPFAFTSYETFLLGQYHIECKGLFYYNGMYLIFCPSVTLGTKSLKGDDLLDHWFEMHKIMGTDIRIVNVLPHGALQIDKYLDQAKSPGTGYLISRADFEYEIDLLIPGIFPDYEIRWSNPLTVAFKDQITQEGVEELERIFSDNCFPLKCKFIYDSAAKIPQKREDLHYSYIIPSRYSRLGIGKLLSEKWEEDQDLWMNNRNAILTDTTKAKGGQDYFNPSKFRCVVDCSTGTPSNIRSYLSLYEEVCLVPPLNNLELMLTSLNVTRAELVELVSMNRVQILAPSSIERYDQLFMESVVEANSSGLHLSRRLTSIVLKENCKRNPLFLPCIGLEEKKLLLQSCEKAVQNLNSPQLIKVQGMLSELGNSWVRMPNAINQMSSGFMVGYGLPDMFDSLLFGDSPNERNFSLAVKLAATPVELTAAVGATLVPTVKEMGPLYQMIADLYSGVPSENWVIQKPDYANLAVENLLVIADKVPVIEFARTFTGAEINRFRDTILAVSQNAKDLEGLEENISAFNHFVKSYEKDKKKLNIVNLSGFILGLGAKSHGIPFASWFIKILQKYVLKQIGYSSSLSEILDRMEANIVGSFPNAVLISRIKTKLKDRI